MPRFRDLSTSQRIAAIAVILAYPALCVATRLLGPASPASYLLPVLYPFAVVLLAQSLALSEAVRGDRSTPAPSMSTLGLGAPPGMMEGRGQAVTSRIAMYFMLLSNPDFLFPHRAAFPGTLILTVWGLWLAAAAFVAFGLPRLTNHASKPPSLSV